MGGRNAGIVKVGNQLSANSEFSVGTTRRPAWEVVCARGYVCLCGSWSESVSGQGI